MKFSRGCLAAAIAIGLCSSHARAASAAPIIQKTTYDGFAAWRLSDGKTEAIAVPQLGRVMSYRRVGGKNWLWNAPTLSPAILRGKSNVWHNSGGDKLWPAPQDRWQQLGGRNWPPDGAWDGPATAKLLPGHRLQLTSAVSAYNGCRVVRVFSFNAAGDFVTEQRVEKLQDPPALLGIWSVTQIVRPEAVFMAANPASRYQDGVLWFPQSGAAPNDGKTSVHRLTPSLIEINGDEAAAYKLGTDAPVSAIVAVNGDTAFVERTSYDGAGTYPDAPHVSTELFSGARPGTDYMELELLGPLTFFAAGIKASRTVTWSLVQLPSSHTGDPATRAVVQKLLAAH